VVHLLKGSALEFTEMYMKARLTRSEPAPDEAKSVGDQAPQNKSERRLTAKLTTDIGDALTTTRTPAPPEPGPVATPATPAVAPSSCARDRGKGG
jgi:hypothetical protein